MSDREIELKARLSSIAENFGHQGHIYIYLEKDKIYFTGNISLSSLTPMLMKAVAERIMK